MSQTKVQSNRGQKATRSRSTTHRASPNGSSRGSATQAKRSSSASRKTPRTPRAKSAPKRGEMLREAASSVAAKAKTPVMVGGAALAGLAGGVAISRNSSSKIAGVIPKPGGGNTTKALGNTAKAFGGAAKEIGKAGFQLGQLTSEVRRVRERLG
jgi:hypothetical protein